MPAPIYAVAVKQARRIGVAKRGKEEFMDLRVFYQKMRKIEQEITGDHPVVVSLETPDGGKPGIRTEVTRENAARMIVEGRCRLATKSEMTEYLKQYGPETK